MTAQELLSTLQANAIEIWVEGDRLKYRSPKGALTPEMRAQMKAHKTQLMALLSSGANGHATNGRMPDRVIRPGPRRGDLPASFAQQRLWFLEQMESVAAPYNELSSLEFSGQLDSDVLQRAMNEIVRRHAVLRTTFHYIDGRVTQRIEPERAVELPLLDLQSTPEPLRSERLAEIARTEAAEPFDLARGPLLRCRLVRMARDRHVLLLVVHHIVSDGWSAGVFLRELTALYSAFVRSQPAPLPEPSLQYVDFATWQRGWLRGETLEKQLAYWREQLADAPASLALPTDRPRPAIQSYRGATVEFDLGETLSSGVSELSRQLDATPFMVLLAGFCALLTRYTGEDDLVVGTPVANRTRAELEGLIGCFVNTLALRVRHGGNPTFAELVRTVRGVTLAAYEHQDTPFELLVDDLQPDRSLSRAPLFQVMFVLQNVPTAELAVPGATIRPLKLATDTSKFDLTLHVVENSGRLHGILEYSTDLFDAATMQRLAHHYRTLLAGVLSAGVDTPLLDLPLLTDGERHQLLVEWNATQRAYGEARPIHQIFAAVAAEQPDACAFVFRGERITYRVLNERANRLAHYLQAHGVGPDVLVGVCLERSVEMVVALYAVLKAGGAYVPLDPAYPTDRLHFMLTDAAVEILLTQQHLAPTLPETAAQIVALDADWPTIATHASTNPAVELTDDHLAYMIYTSGSTGRPKGAMNTHGAIRNRLLWMQEIYALGADDCVLQKTPFSFDVSVWEFFWPLMVGARLVVAEPGGHQDGDYLVRTIQDEQISTIHFVPSMLTLFLDAEGVAACDSLRRVICSGEALPADLARRFCARLDAELHNLYGPTEAAIDVTHWHCQPDDPRDVVPIGRPVANTQIYILDANLQPVPIGVAGELHIGGVQLARGYHNRPDLTAARFIPDPFATDARARLYKTGDLARFLPDGSIQYLGRLDFQVKIRGFRIELGEIEACLLQLPAVREAVVVVSDPASTNPQLVAYFVPAGQAPTTSELHHHLRQRLPDQMIPAVFVPLDAMPLSPNGKVDRRALPAPDGLRPRLAAAYRLPHTDTEQILTAIWAEVIGVDRVGVDDNYFELGGDSIRSVQVVARAKAAGLVLTLQMLFQYQTVGELARQIDHAVAAQTPLPQVEPFALLDPADRARLPAGLADAYPLAALQAGILFHAEYSPESAIFHDIFSSHLRAPFDPDAFQWAVQTLIDRHPALRTGFAATGFSEPLQLVHAQVDAPPLRWADLRHLDEAAQERALDAAIDAERTRPFRWDKPPLVRFQLHRRSDDSFQLTVGFFHAILDGWSVATMMTELFQCYLAAVGERPNPLQAPPAATYRNFVALERCTLHSATDRDYWAEKVQDVSVLQLPRGPRSAETDAVGLGIQPVPLSDELAAGLERVARLAGVPLKSVLLAAHMTVLSALGNQRDVLTGLVSNGRVEEPDGERVLGLFLNTVPLRLQLDPHASWIELVRTVFRAERELLPFRRYPLSQIQQLAGGQILSETMFNFMRFHVYQALRGAGPLELLDGRYFEQTNYPLVASFSQDIFTEQIHLTLDYDKAQLVDTQVAAIGDYYARTLAAMVADPEQQWRTFSVLSPREREQQLSAWNATDAPLPPDLCLHQLFEAQATRSPHAIAVTGGGQSLTYAELNRRANQLARHLRGLDVGPEVLVGVCVQRTPMMVASLLAVLKAGGAYVPLDPAYPAERLTAILRDAQPRVILTQAAVADALPHQAADRVDLDRAWSQIETLDAQNLAPYTTPSSAAYVLFTSGSTGRPKGILIEHRSPVALVAWARALYSADELAGVLASTSLTFDLSIFEIFVPLTSGGTVIVAENALALPDLPEAANVTLINTVPSAMVELLRLNALPPTVRTVNLAGEPLRSGIVRALYRLPHVRRVYNLYGPSEDTTYSTFTLVARTLDREPTIGRPIANTRAYILTDAGEPTPIGVAGELHLSGAGLARGYLHQPELTAEKFVPCPFARPDDPDAMRRMYRTGDRARYLPDGQIEFLGRLDHQVKIRGYRIELGEIEAVLAEHSAVREVVTSVHHGNDDPQIIAYLVERDGHTTTDDALRAHCAQWLPAYMVPARFVVLEQMPLTPNGKINRRALPALEPHPSPTAPIASALRTSTEVIVAAIWSDLLGVGTPGAEDDFFALGGHSLLASRLAARLRTEFETPLPLAVVFERPTLRDLAAYLDAGGDERSGSPPHLPECVVPLRTSGAGRPIFCLPPVAGSPLAYLELARGLDGENPVYGLQTPDLHGEPLTFNSLDALATHFVTAMRQVQPAGPYALVGWSFGGMLAYEVARQLEAQDQTVAPLMLIESGLPSASTESTRTQRGAKLAAPRQIARLMAQIQAPGSYQRLRTMARWIGISLPDAEHRPGTWSLLRLVVTELLRVDRVLRRNARLAADYRPKPYQGRVLLVRGAASEPVHADPHVAALRELAHQVDIVVVPGNHMSIMLDPANARAISLLLQSSVQLEVTPS